MASFIELCLKLYGAIHIYIFLFYFLYQYYYLLVGLCRRRRVLGHVTVTMFYHLGSRVFIVFTFSRVCLHLIHLPHLLPSTFPAFTTFTFQPYFPIHLLSIQSSLVHPLSITLHDPTIYDLSHPGA